jgi:hypothetical protein
MVKDNTSFTYAGGAVPDFVMLDQFIIDNSWNTAKVDQCLIALAARSFTTGTDRHTIDLSGTNEARSAASNAAVIDLEGRGFTVITTT